MSPKDEIDAKEAAEAPPARNPNGVMAGKRGLIMGVANGHSMAWGIARAIYAEGAELAFTYQNEAIERRVAPLAESLGASVLMPCDVEDEAAVETAFDALLETWPSVDFVVHAIANSDKSELRGRYVETSRENFRRTLDISCYSFTTLARVASQRMPAGGSLLTLTFSGSQRVVPNYNVMGVAKAALESSVRYLAADLGPQGIRVNALSAGPMRTLAGSAIGGARHILRWCERQSPLRRNVTLDDVGGAALFLLSDLSSGVTGETVHVDSGYHAIGIPAPEA